LTAASAPRYTAFVAATPGERFPSLELTLTDGRTLALPDGLDAGWAVVLFTRGHF
jgi:hypothetical protein